MTAAARELGRRAEVLLDRLATFSDDEGRLTRLYLSPAHRRAADQVAEWMKESGLSVSMDALGTVRGSLPPGTKGRTANRRLLIGSHIDTVVDAGRYDGALGVVAGILVVEELRKRTIRLPFGLDILAFGDEEGVRFPATLMSSSASAGVLDPATLDVRDAAGISVREALRLFGCNPALARQAAYAPGDVLGYLEVHIEQGPVLEAEKAPLGVVTSIAGQSRFEIKVKGTAGHAGTVPMAMRKDALAAAAELVLLIEAIGKKGAADQLVATVGQLTVEPGAVNVIPANVRLTLDIRAATDSPRMQAIAEIERRMAEICQRRGVDFVMTRFHESPTTPCAPPLQQALADAVAGLGLPVRRLTSGAGHDGQAMSHLCGVGMLFLRCRDGISHNPREFAEAADMELAVETLLRAVIALGETMAD